MLVAIMQKQLVRIRGVLVGGTTDWVQTKHDLSPLLWSRIIEIPLLIYTPGGQLHCDESESNGLKVKVCDRLAVVFFYDKFVLLGTAC